MWHSNCFVPMALPRACISRCSIAISSSGLAAILTAMPSWAARPRMRSWRFCSSRAPASEPLAWVGSCQVRDYGGNGKRRAGFLSGEPLALSRHGSDNAAPHPLLSPFTMFQSGNLYADLAGYYDQFCAEVDYAEQCEFALRAFSCFGDSGGKNYLDLACGTGQHLQYMATCGFVP